MLFKWYYAVLYLFWVILPWPLVTACTVIFSVGLNFLKATKMFLKIADELNMYICILAWPQWGSFADINQQEVVFAKIGKISFEFDCNFNVKQTHEKSLICTIACEFWQRCRLISNSRINYFLCIVPPSSYFNELRKLTRKKKLGQI